MEVARDVRVPLLSRLALGLRPAGRSDRLEEAHGFGEEVVARKRRVISQSGTSTRARHESRSKGVQVKHLRFLLVTLVLVIGGSVLAQTVLRMNTLFHSGDAQAMVRIVDEFNEVHDDVQIELTQGQWSDYYAQLYNAVVADNAPHIGVVHTTLLPQMAPALTPSSTALRGTS